MQKIKLNAHKQTYRLFSIGNVVQGAMEWNPHQARKVYLNETQSNFHFGIVVCFLKGKHYNNTCI